MELFVGKKEEKVTPPVTAIGTLLEQHFLLYIQKSRSLERDFFIEKQRLKSCVLIIYAYRVVFRP